MSKALSNILTVFKIARIVAKVVFILCAVGCAGCLLALSVLPIFGGVLPTSVVGEGLDLPSTYLSCIVGMIACAGNAVFAFLAERYFANTLNAGTPFTFAGAKESFRLGLASIITSAAISIASGIAFEIFLLVLPTVSEFEINISVSLSTGVFFLFLSMIFKYGAELKESADKKLEQEETDLDTNTL